MKTSALRPEQLAEKLVPAGFQKIIASALEEDIGSGDITSLATIPAHKVSSGKILCRETGIAFGLAIAAEVFRQIDKDLEFRSLCQDGQPITEPSTELAHIKGATQAILAGERVALNFLQRLSGIATLTAACQKQAEKFGIAILDTRKTTPTLRAMEKAAVRAGGGTNHRSGLFDAILIKDNHIKAAGSLTNAVHNCRKYNPQLQISVEIDNLLQLKEALALQCNRVLLDNMQPAEIQKCIELINGRCFIEVSGGINAANLNNFLLPGINAVSMGSLTHSVQALDISLELED